MSVATAAPPPPSPAAAPTNAALLLSFHPHARPLALVLGSTRLASSRATLFLQAGQQVLVVDDKPLAAAADDVRLRVGKGELAFEQAPWRAVLDGRRDEVGLVCVVDSGTSAVAPAPSARAAAPVGRSDREAPFTDPFHSALLLAPPPDRTASRRLVHVVLAPAGG